MHLPQFKIFMVIKSILTGVFGVAMFVLPGPLFWMFGVDLEVGGILVTRLFGAALVILGLQIWSSRNAIASKELGRSTIAASLGDILGFAVVLVAQWSGVMNDLGWLLVLIYTLSACGFGYFYKANARAIASG